MRWYLALLATLLATGAGYPKFVKKTLYASNDLRGGHAPTIEVAKWLTGSAPKTEGKVVLVDMWATWCPSCRDLIPDMNGWSSKFKNDLVVIGISDEDATTVNQFRKHHPMDYNVAVDAKQRLMKKVGVEAVPQVLVITPDHIVRWQGYPGEATDKLTTEKLADIIQESKLGK